MHTISFLVPSPGKFHRALRRGNLAEDAVQVPCGRGWAFVVRAVCSCDLPAQSDIGRFWMDNTSMHGVAARIEVQTDLITRRNTEADPKDWLTLPYLLEDSRTCLKCLPLALALELIVSDIEKRLRPDLVIVIVRCAGETVPYTERRLQGCLALALSVVFSFFGARRSETTAS